MCDLSSTFAIEPDVPRDSLAAAEGAQWAAARRNAVLSLPVDERLQGLFASLRGLDELLIAWESGDDRAALLDDRDLSDATEDIAIELGADEISEAERPDPVAAFVKSGNRERHAMANAETIVLSGPDVRRKIRHKQSVLPSYMAQVLYEDIGALFEIGDREGALVSLERLLTVAPVTPQIETFLSHNEARLLEYYESVLGPWTRVVRMRTSDSPMPAAYFRFEKMATVVKLIDGRRTLNAVLAECGLRKIEACAVLSQLARSASLDLGEKH